MNVSPFAIARFGAYGALAVAAFSVWLTTQGGTPLPDALMRGVIVFVVFTALAFAADALLTAGVHLPHPHAREHHPEPPPAAPPPADEAEEE